MDLFLVPNNPEHTVLVSPNGVAHYQVSTSKVGGGLRVSRIQRPAESEADSVVAEIEWKSWATPTVVRSPLFGGIGVNRGVPATKFLYKRSAFSSSRYFLGDDEQEYRWKVVRGVGSVLTNSGTQEEVARYIQGLSKEGLFAGEKKSRLIVQPCSVDMDLVVLSFMIMEKKRRDHAGDGTGLVAHDEDPQGDGGGDGGAAM